MSLINEALKKAQAEQARQHTPISAVPGAVSPQQAAGMLVPERPARRSSSTPMIMGMLGGAVVMAIIAAGAFWLLWPKTPAPAPIASAPTPAVPTPAPAVPVATSPTPASPSPAPAPVAPVASTPAPVVAAPASTPAAPVAAAPAPVAIAQPAPPPVVAPTPVVVAPPVAPEPAPVAAAPVPVVAPVVVEPSTPQPRPEIDAFLHQLQVRGVMSGGRKIILFDPSLGQSRAYATGDLLNTRAKITIARITENEIVFKDDAGVTYTKPF